MLLLKIVEKGSVIIDLQMTPIAKLLPWLNNKRDNTQIEDAVFLTEGEQEIASISAYRDGVM